MWLKAIYIYIYILEACGALKRASLLVGGGLRPPDTSLHPDKVFLHECRRIPVLHIWARNLALWKLYNSIHFLLWDVIGPFEASF